MTIVRGSLPRRNFTILDNPTICDDRLTYRALGLLTFLLSKPEGWRVNSEDLAEPDGREGRDAIRTALRELEAAGYLVRRKFQNDRGQHVTESVVYDTPVESTDPVDNLPPTTGFQSSVTRLSVSQALKNQELYVSTQLGESDIPSVDCSTCENTGWIEQPTGEVSECADCDHRVTHPSDRLVPASGLRRSENDSQGPLSERQSSSG